MPSLPHNHGENEIVLFTLSNDNGNFSYLADVFRQLCDENRIRLFWILCHCEECVINLSALMKMSSPAVSHHLKMLKSSGLVVSRREGKEVYYTAARTEEAMELHKAVESLAFLKCPGAIKEHDDAPIGENPCKEENQKWDTD